jgi:hypothetical protein
MPESIAQFAERFDLQIALLVIGTLLILSLLTYNILRTRKVKKQLMSHLAKGYMEENLLSEPPTFIEPTLNDSSNRVEPSWVNSLNLDPEITSETRITQDVKESTEDLSSTYSSKMDPNIDCVVALRFSLLVQGNEILQLMSSWPTNPTYRFASEGLYEIENSHFWELIQPDHSYREIQLSMQLANRRGPIRNEELAEFLGLASELSNELDAEIDLPPMANVLALAEDLDQFAIQCDIQLGFNLVPNMISWDTKEIEKALISNGFFLARDGLYFNYFDRGYRLFKAQIPSLNFLTDDLQTARVKSILFALEVPLVPEEFHAFSKMLEVCQKIAQELDGKVLDDNGQVLEISSVDMITAQLEPIYGLMRERQILPGSASAARLFS